MLPVQSHPGVNPLLAHRHSMLLCGPMEMAQLVHIPIPPSNELPQPALLRQYYSTTGVDDRALGLMNYIVCFKGRP